MPVRRVGRANLAQAGVGAMRPAAGKWRYPAMRRCAESVGFTEEGRLRESGWAGGRFGDDVIYGLLASEWRTPAAGRSGAAAE